MNTREGAERLFQALIVRGGAQLTAAAAAAPSFDARTARGIKVPEHTTWGAL